jgi:hypothetical protein
LSHHRGAANRRYRAADCLLERYIDLTALSTAWYDTLGSKDAGLAFHANAGATHTNLAGADKLAALLAKAIKDQNIGLAKYLRP